MILQIFEIIGWILCSLILLIIIAYLLLPWVFKHFVSPLFNATYVYDKNDFQDNYTQITETHQIHTPELLIDESNGIYKINIGENHELSDGIIKIRYQQSEYSNHIEKSQKIKPLNLLDFNKQNFSDKLGDGLKYQFHLSIDNTNLSIKTNIKEYSERNFYIFELQFPNDLNDMGIGRFESTITGFPSFINNTQFNKIFTYKHSIFCPPSRKLETTSAPVVFYDDDLNCFILSPLDGFLNAVISEDEYGRINCGIQGEIKKIPEKYTQKYLLYFGKGINDSMKEMADIIIDYHDSKRKDLYADIVCSHLGFWTDNGAYYYYKTERGMDYDDTLVEIKNYFDKHKIPIRYYNFDSWWYLKHTNKAFTTLFRPLVRLMGGGLYGNTLRWETDPEKFKTDLRTFHQERFKKPITAHSRRWDARSPYLKKFKFKTYKNHAVPLKIDFWNWLMKHANRSGIVVYEQDWMKNQIAGVPFLREQLNAKNRWLNNMATAAKNNDVNVFYCMQTPEILLSSIKHPNITITRCSGDYNHRWPLTYRYIHSTQTNILINAFGLVSHPDVFRSRSMDGVKFRPFGEKYPYFKCLYQNLNAGPICPGDKKENVNWELLNKTCRDDGLLFKPDQALTANDLMFRKHRKYYICDTFTERENYKWIYILITNIWPKRVKEEYVKLSELGYPDSKYVLYDYLDKNLEIIDQKSKIEVGKLGKYEYKYYILNPILANGMSLIGCVNKFIPCSKKQFKSITCSSNSLIFSIEELANVELVILIYSPHKPSSITLEESSKLEEGSGLNQWKFENGSKKLIIRLKFDITSTKTLKLLN